VAGWIGRAEQAVILADSCFAAAESAQVVSPLTTLLSPLSGFGTMPSKRENQSRI
jgi:hypothetical protein